MVRGYRKGEARSTVRSASGHTWRDVGRWLASVVGASAWIAVSVAAVWLLLPGCQTIVDSLPTTRADAGPRVDGMFEGEPEVRVRVQSGVRTIEVTGPAQVVVRHAGTANIKPQIVKTPLTITSGAAGVTIASGGSKSEWGLGNDIDILPGDGRHDGQLTGAGESLKLSGTRYPGFVTLRPAWSSSPAEFDVVVSMSVESYLPGVLTHELLKDWPRQTYEAQAIAARTYVLHERSRARRERRAYDVEDTDADQVFGGATTAVVPVEAARATRGLVLTYRGQLLRAYYSSTCGGRPASAAYAWPRKPETAFNLAAPLQGQPREHACQRATLYRWSVERSVDDVSRRMRSWGRINQHAVGGISRVRSIRVDERNDAQRPNTFIVTDDTGHDYEMTAEEVRMSCNFAIPDSTPITRETRVSSGDLEADVWATTVRFSGRGWGHGVGMCQWCAKGFADLGWDWASMLKEFYPGAEVIKAY